MLNPKDPATDEEIKLAELSVMGALLDNPSNGTIRLCRILKRLEIMENRNNLGGCQMPKRTINGYCSVCGSPNVTCHST